MAPRLLPCLALCPSSPRLDHVRLSSRPRQPEEKTKHYTDLPSRIASALFWIAKDFDKISQQNWIVSSFNLTSSAFIPFWAQIADVFGRSAALSSAILLMVVGSTLCTAAPTSAYAVLLLGRALQGVAASGLGVLTRTVLADSVSLEESAKSWAILSIVGGVSYGLGPVIGGFLTKVNWRWCFAINLPIGVFSLVVVLLVLRRHLLGPQPIPELDETHETGRRTRFLARLKTVDLGGQLLFIAGFGLLILGLTWGGAAHPWSSPAVIGPLVAGAVLLAAFVLWERLLEPGHPLADRLPRQRPMIPWALLSTRDMALLFCVECATGAATFSVLYFGSTFFVRVQGHGADRAGLQLLCFVPGLGAGACACALLCSRWPRMTYPPLLLGTVVETTGVAGLAWAMHAAHSPSVLGMMALVGVGMGFKFMVAPLHGIGVFKTHRASVLALVGIAVPFGGTVGLTIMSAVFNNTSGLDAKDGEYAEGSVDSVKNGMVWAYVSIVPFMALSCVACLFMGNVILGKEGSSSGHKEDAVIREPYLWYLLRAKHSRCDTKSIAMEPIGRGRSYKEIPPEESA
ncbi:Major facilitator superfamily domain, general substrate transporter [Cordyceps fumosorosea ARSEF 2679]|uniref:Major facilitator superfamily domain, general substrate transporter n=1 Tax=Cordyceps fumosorosea (strain ARSEF 2679) TaxID=1081104 RepID=A0A167S533_CORFA|nr:Major facilitator superfamily domain, general substrate transporter [Cordyceps fumosorosea ARSEF 2679]OAA59261.1 Major facilitator superfamily domain, general substrate transporter [Cordyceps fumosorosea ARSEF 2679]